MGPETSGDDAVVKRPVLRYHGGKWVIAPWIIGFLPPHRVYVEPFGGAASVLMRKPRAFAEVYNDLDGDIVNVFQVLRDPVSAARLKALIELTPWSRREFRLSYERSDDPIEQARRTIVRCYMGHGTTSRRKNATGFRAKVYRQHQTGTQDWVGWPTHIPHFAERLRGVCIESRPALEIIAQQDSPETLFYVDPPYPLSTRSAMKGRSSLSERTYAHELTDEDHAALADVLGRVEGMVVLSGYPCALYDELYGGWERHERPTMADGGAARTEVVWLNPACSVVRGRPRLDLLDA